MKKMSVVAMLGAFALALATPQPVDAQSKIKFKYPKRLDFLMAKARCVLLSDSDPLNEDVNLTVRNPGGEVFTQTLPAGSFIPNRRGTVFKYKLKRTGYEMIYLFIMKQKLIRGTGEVQYIFKVKADANLGAADPARNPTLTEEQLAHMHTVIVVGDDVCSIHTDWNRKPYGWFLAEKYWNAE